MTVRSSFVILVVLASLCLYHGSPPVLAQETPTLIRLDESAFGTLTGDAPSARFILTSKGDQSILVQVFGLGTGFGPRFRVLDPAGSVVFDATNADGLSTVESTGHLPTAGAYTIEVDSANGMPGEFVLTVLAGVSAPEPVNLLVGEPVSAVAGGDTPLHVYQFALSQSASLSILSDGAASGPAVTLKDANGLVLATSSGGTLLGVTHVLSPTDMLYHVEVSAVGSSGDISFTICLGCMAAPAADAGAEELPVAPPESAPASVPVVAACSVVSSVGGPVNVRSGPTTGFSVIGSLQPGQSLPATGQLAGGGWFQVNLSGQTGWVGGSVARLDGDCATLSVVAAPAAPPPPPAAPTAIPTTHPLPPAPVATEEVPTPQSLPPGDAPNTDVIPPAEGSSNSGGSGGFVPVPDSISGDSGGISPFFLLPDLVPYDVRVENRLGGIVLSAGVMNFGQANATGTIMRLCIDGNCETATVLPLMSGSGSGPIAILFTNDPATATSYHIRVDAGGQVVETDETNNIASGQIGG